MSERKRPKGSIRQRGAAWQIRFATGTKPNGQPIIREETVRGDRDAAEWLLKKRITEYLAGTLGQPAGPTVLPNDDEPACRPGPVGMRAAIGWKPVLV